MTIKEQLIALGMKETEIDNYYSTLYVKVNDISKQFVSEYKYKNQVNTFIDNIDHELYYDIPFGYANEDFKERYGKEL